MDKRLAKILLQILKNQEHIMNEQKLNHSHERGLRAIEQTSELCKKVGYLIDDEEPRWVKWRFSCNTCQKIATKHFEGVGQFLIHPAVICEKCGSECIVELEHSLEEGVT